jgi:hypothetical protein
LISRKERRIIEEERGKKKFIPTIPRNYFTEVEHFKKYCCAGLNT